jgi:hypothetical protein
MMMDIEEEKGAEEQPRKRYKGRTPGAKNVKPAKGGGKRSYTAEQAERKNELRRKRRLVVPAAKASDVQQVERMVMMKGNAVIS